MGRSDLERLDSPAPAEEGSSVLRLVRAPVGSSVRFGIAGLCLLTIGVLAWLLAAPGQPGMMVGVYSVRRFGFLVVSAYSLLWCAYFALAGGTLVRKLTNCALATVSFLLVWGLLELPAVVGIIDYRMILSSGRGALGAAGVKPWEDPHNRFDAELMYTRRPGEHIVAETTGDLIPWLGISTTRRYQIDVKYDRNGFRNATDFRTAPVALIGDSFLEAGLVPDEAIVSTRLRRLLNVDVVNLGLGGYGPQQELVTLQRYALPLQPQLVIWFFFEGNDLLDARRYEAFARDAQAHFTELHSFRNRSLSQQALRLLTYATAVSSKNDSIEAQRRSCRLRSNASDSTDTLYLCYHPEPLSSEDLDSLEIVERTLLEARHLTIAAGARLMLVYVPVKFRVYKDLCDPPVDGYARAWSLNDLPNRLERWSAAHGIPFLDLTGPLREHATQGELVYFPDDGHWNDRGNAVAAQAVADAIKERGWQTAQE